MQFFTSLAMGAGTMPQATAGGATSQSSVPLAGLFERMAASALGLDPGATGAAIPQAQAQAQMIPPTAEEGEVKADAGRSPDPNVRPTPVEGKQAPVMPLAPEEVLPEEAEQVEDWEHKLLPTAQELSTTERKSTPPAPRGDFVPLAALGLLGSLDARREEAGLVPTPASEAAPGTPGRGTGWVAGGDAAARLPHTQASAVISAPEPQVASAEAQMGNTVPVASTAPAESEPVAPGQSAEPRVAARAEVSQTAPRVAEAPRLPQLDPPAKGVAVEVPPVSRPSSEPIAIRVEGELPRALERGEPETHEISLQVEQREVRASVRGLADPLPESEVRMTAETPPRGGAVRDLPAPQSPGAAVAQNAPQPPSQPVATEAVQTQELPEAAPTASPQPNATPRLTPSQPALSSPDTEPPDRSVPQESDLSRVIPQWGRRSLDAQARPMNRPPVATTQDPTASAERRQSEPLLERTPREPAAARPLRPSTASRPQSASITTRPVREPAATTQPVREIAAARPRPTAAVPAESRPLEAAAPRTPLAQAEPATRSIAAPTQDKTFTTVTEDAPPRRTMPLARPMSSGEVRSDPGEQPVRTTAPEVRQKLMQAASQSGTIRRFPDAHEEWPAEPVRATQRNGVFEEERVSWDAQRSTRSLTPPAQRSTSGEAEPAAARPVRPWWLRGPQEVATQHADAPTQPAAVQRREGERVPGVQVPTGQPVSAGRPGNEGPEGVSSWRPVAELMEEPTLQPSPPREATPIPTPHTDALADTLAHGARLAGRGEALGTDLTLPPKVAVISSQTAYWIRSSFRLGRRESVVTLDPPDLGRMRISLREDGPQLTARIQTELPEVASILREGAEAIRERLESQGLRIDHLVIESVGDRAQRPATVETPQGQQAHSDLGTGAQERRGEFQRSAPSAAQATRESEVPPDPAVEETQTVAPGLHRLDLRV